MVEFHIDFFPVGNSRSGDSIVIALSPRTNNQYLIVVDGGFRSDGVVLAQYIRDEYNSEFVDLVVCSHPDEDHSAGLAPVLQELDVGMLWLHRPARHLRLARQSQTLTEDRAHLIQASVNHVLALEDLASERSIPLCEPFEGLSYAGGRVVVVGPSVGLYRAALENFRSSNRSHLERQFERLAEAMGELQNTTRRRDLGNGENTSSVVLLFQSESGVSVLLTADATQLALREAMNYSRRALGFNPLRSLDVIQVPHHGAFRNVGPWLIESIDVALAVVSASKADPHHPNQVVIDAFGNLGSEVDVTAGDVVRIVGYNDGTYEVVRF